jgi:dephospho-CoA kinase
VEPGLPVEKALPILINEMERASRDLQSEASLVFAPGEIAKLNGLWRSLGYEPREPKVLGVQAWQEAAQESMPAGTTLYFKQLRTDRVLRPI